jgi:hypothetical protein
VVQLVVLLTPPADHGVRGRDDDVVNPFATWNALRQGGRRKPDARPQLEDIHRAEHLAKQPGYPIRGMNLC